MDLELGACLFHKRRRDLGEYSEDGGDPAGFGVVGGHVRDVLDVWPNEVVQRVQVGGGEGPVREEYKIVALLLKPSLGLFGLVGWRQVLLLYPGSATSHLIAPGDYHTLQHIQVHFGVDFEADFKDVRWHDVALTWNHTKDHNSCRKLCFHHPRHIPVIWWFWLLCTWSWQKFFLSEKNQSMFGFLICFSLLSNLTDLIILRFFVFSVKIWLVWSL